jgi:ATP-dependent DNA ligase
MATPGKQPGPDDAEALLKTALGSHGGELAVYAFDLLHLIGQDLKSPTVIQRRHSGGPRAPCL